MAVLLFQAFVAPAPLTRDEVANDIASALASVTPPPPAAEVVYQEIAPSFVIIQAAEAPASGVPGASPAPAASPNGSGAPGDSGVLGSGVIVNSQGEILTALHVVADAAAIQVTFADGSTAAATIVTREPASDIAVLQAAQLPTSAAPATLGNPRSVRVGDDAYLVGNPFGLAGSISAGVVSGLDRSFRAPGSGQELTGLIQVDAAVNPGNSGGPLVNRDGEVIGIVTGLVNPTGQNVFIGIGLAVPIDVAGGAAGLPPD